MVEAYENQVAEHKYIKRGKAIKMKPVSTQQKEIYRHVPMT